MFLSYGHSVEVENCTHILHMRDGGKCVLYILYREKGGKHDKGLFILYYKPCEERPMVKINPFCTLLPNLLRLIIVVY